MLQKERGWMKPVYMILERSYLLAVTTQWQG